MEVSRLSKDEMADLAVKMAAGTQGHLTSFTQVMLEGLTYTPVQLVERLKALARRRFDVDAAKAEYEGELEVAAAHASADHDFMLALVAFVMLCFGTEPPILHDFGLEPKKERTPPTADEVAAAVAKRAATREARGTKGPKARLAVHGDVTGVTVTPITTGTSAPATAAPAAAGKEGAQK
jgi:hypothetical protein